MKNLFYLVYLCGGVLMLMIADKYLVQLSQVKSKYSSRSAFVYLHCTNAALAA